MMRSLPPELALVAACCRWPPSPARETAIRGAATRPIDWVRFDRVVARHRVVALARDGLRSAGVAVPAAVAARQAEAAAAAGRSALAMARETLRLQQAFDAAGIPALFVKGATLAMLGYGTLGIKQSWDIDLLTSRENALAGRHLLESLGYEAIKPAGFDDAKFVRFADFAIEALFHNASRGTYVELHWGLTHNACLLPGLAEEPATQTVALAGAAARTLADEALFAYLAAHGTAHAWARLKWLADVGAFLAPREPAEIERLYRAAAAHGAGRTAAVALLLCHRLLGLPLSGRLLHEVRADRGAKALAGNALRCIAYGGGAGEFPDYSVPVLRTIASRFFLVPGHRYFLSQLRLKWRSPDDRLRFDLPRSVAFLYPLLRLPLWLGRFGRRMIGRVTG